MEADLGLLSLDQLQRLAQSHHQQQQQQNPNSTEGLWMWNTRQNQEDDDSWEVRAFAQDTNSILGTTWPPRSYTCTFCRREFRSAQALGGHMNVHRRDRAKLRQSPPTSSPSFVFPSQEFVPNSGLCLFYSLPNPNTRVFNSTSLNVCLESTSTLLSISPYPNNNFLPPSFEPLDSTPTTTIHESLFQTAIIEPIPNQDDNNHTFTSIGREAMNKDKEEELDLELRLGSGPAPPRHI